MALQRLTIKNLTVFSSADLTFSKTLNVIVGENGAGKTHLLKFSLLSDFNFLGRRQKAKRNTPN